jgi:hypothetical protein
MWFCYNAPMSLTEALAPVALEAILLLLLSRLLFAAVISSVADRRGKGLVLGLLRLPGNLVHEWSHCVGFLVCGYRVQRVLLCIFDPKGRGSCTPGKPWSPITFPHLAIGLSALMPLVGGSVVLLLAARWLGISAHAVPTAQGDLAPLVWRHALSLLHNLNLHHWQTWVFLYLALSIGAELAPSSTDLRYALPTVIILTAGTWLFFFGLQHATNLQSYRHLLAEALCAGLLRLGSVLSLSLVTTAAATVVGLIPGLTIQALRK